MANGHGGNRTPSDPAPVSGPGRLSRRTDGGPAQKLRDVTGLPYGENQELNTQQAAAPLSQTPDAGVGGASAPAGPVMPQVTGFDQPSQRPDEPVTAGSPLGPGPGPTVMGVNPYAAARQSAQSILTSVLQTANSPEAQALLQSLQVRN